MTELDRRQSAITQADYTGQGTQIEQARAVAQVLAQFEWAQRRPRDEGRAIRAMQDVCGLKGLAERAFFSFNRGDGNVNGATIHLARELARIWQNVDYGLVELRRDDERLFSEMLAFAVDLETNVRVSTQFNVPHKRDGKKGTEPAELTQLRDVYENNANMGGRRMRSQIYAILPKWLTDQAEDLCRETLKRGESGVPMAQRIVNVVDRFASELGVSAERIETRLHKPRKDWTPDDLVNLGIVYKTLQRGEQTVAEAFPEAAVTGDAIAAQAATAAPARGRARKAPTPAAPAVDADPDADPDLLPEQPASWSEGGDQS